MKTKKPGQRERLKNRIHQARDLSARAARNQTILQTADEVVLDESESLLRLCEALQQGGDSDPVAVSTDPQLLADSPGSEWAELVLTSRGFDLSTLRLEDLLSQQEVLAIERELNRDLSERLRWDRWDYGFVFGAAVAGAIADFLFGDPKEGLSSYLSDKTKAGGKFFEKIHKLQRKNAAHRRVATDFQGKHFGGRGHRLISPAHDLLRFVEGIRQIRSGEFRGVRYDKNSRPHFVRAVTDADGTRPLRSPGEAMWIYSVHVFCDFFSVMSLPVRGFSFLSSAPRREIRKFAATMYEEGYNLRHASIQALGVLAVEVPLRTYHAVRMRNLGVTDETKDLKLTEMLLLAHAIVTGINVGKVVVDNAYWQLNLPQMLAVCYHFSRYVLQRRERKDRIAKHLRNIKAVSKEAERLYRDSLRDDLSSPDLRGYIEGPPLHLS